MEKLCSTCNNYTGYECVDRGEITFEIKDCAAWLPLITLSIYQEDVLRTTPKHFTGINAIECGLIGAATEAGEALDCFKKFKYQGHTLHTEHIISELGDQLYYIALAAKGLGYTLEGVLRYNVRKRLERYPEGFNAEQSINRVV